MVQEPSHVKQLSPIHVCKIGLNNWLVPQQPSAGAVVVGRSSGGRSCGGGGRHYIISGCGCSSYSSYSPKDKSGRCGEEGSCEVANLCHEKRLWMVCGAQSQPSRSWISTGCPMKEKIWKKTRTGRSWKRRLSFLCQ
jgi:hypothetical protein